MLPKTIVCKSPPSPIRAESVIPPITIARSLFQSQRQRRYAQSWSLGSCGKSLPGALANQSFLKRETSSLKSPVLSLSMREMVVAISFVLSCVNGTFERLVILFGPLLHAHHNFPIHLQKTPVGIPRKIRIARFRRDDVDRGVVHPKIEDGVHHTRHRIASAGTNRNQERALLAAKLLVTDFSIFARASSTCLASCGG